MQGLREEARKEMGRRMGRETSRGGDSAPLVRPLPSSTAPLYERGCTHFTRCPVLSLSSPLLYYHYLLYYMYY